MAAGPRASGVRARPCRGRLVIGIAAVLLAVLVAVWLGNRDAEPTSGTDEPTETPSRSPSQTRPRPRRRRRRETPTETPDARRPRETPTEPEPTTVEVDPASYVGRDRKDVEKELRELGPGARSAVELENPGDQADGIVESVEPSGTLEEGDTVTVSY